MVFGRSFKIGDLIWVSGFMDIVDGNYDSPEVHYAINQIHRVLSETTNSESLFAYLYRMSFKIDFYVEFIFKNSISVLDFIEKLRDNGLPFNYPVKLFGGNFFVMQPDKMVIHICNGEDEPFYHHSFVLTEEMFQRMKCEDYKLEEVLPEILIEILTKLESGVKLPC